MGFWTGLLTLYRKLAAERASFQQQMEENPQDPSPQISVYSKDIREVGQLSAMVKRQSILLFGCICSSLITTAFAAVSFEGTALICFDVSVNAVCIWLMFTESESVWHCCSRYGCCCICYI